MDIVAAFAPWRESVLAQIPGVELFDAHTHLGQNDPDGFKQQPDELLEQLRAADARGAFVFPMHEPDGYPVANDMVVSVSAESGGLLVPFCRVSPNGGGSIEEAERSLASGAKGIKLHPRAERFTLDHPDVRRLAALAHERSLPILIHAGRGIPALGQHVVQLARQFPGTRFILAHAAVCDLSWIWRAATDLPNLLFDTSWWIPADLLALFTLVPPGQILFASDSPYGNVTGASTVQLRYALQAGLSPAQIRCLSSEQSLRIAAAEPLAPAGPAVGELERAPHVLLDRVANYIMLGTILTMRAVDNGPEMLALARQACDVPDELDDAPVFAAVLTLLDAFDAATAAAPEDRRRLGLLMLAAAVARTPDVPVPAL
jgi:uncharacterized protein